MKLEYRIANRNNKFFPQVRIKKFLFWSRWKKIAEHPTGYGIYPLPDLDYPKTMKESQLIIKDFDRWFKKENTIEESHIDFMV